MTEFKIRSFLENPFASDFDYANNPCNLYFIEVKGMGVG